MTEPNIESRKEALLQRFFDDEIDPSEAGELLNLLRKYPDWSENASAEFETEQLFRFHKDRRTTLSPARLEELKASLRTALGEIEPCDWDDATFLSLVQFEKNAPRLDGAEQQQTQNHSVFDFLFRKKNESKSTPLVPSRRNRSALRRFSLPLVLICVAGLAVTAIYREFFSVRDQTEFASNTCLAEIDVAVDVRPGKNGMFVKKGQRLRNDRIQFESGLVRLRFDNGVRMVLEGPMDIRLNSSMKTICDSGRLSVFVPPAGKGFEVATPHLTVRDLGTEFVVDVSEKESAVHVVQGKVEADWFGGDRQVFGAGEAIRMNSEARKPTRFIAEPELFASENNVRRIDTESREKRRSEWKPLERRQQADPNLLFSLEKASNRGCRRVKGMFDEWTALRFQSPKDYVDFAFKGEHRNLTLLAVVRLEDMISGKNFSNTLCIGDGILDVPGEFLWQVDRSGAVFFHIRKGKDIQRFETGPVIDRSQWGTWMFLAVVVDAEKGAITHFLDGKAIATFPWKNPLPLRMDRGTVGNKRPDRNDLTARFWNGEIDTFRVFSRSFDEREITNIFNTFF